MTQLQRGPRPSTLLAQQSNWQHTNTHTQQDKQAYPCHTYDPADGNHGIGIVFLTILETILEVAGHVSIIASHRPTARNPGKCEDDREYNVETFQLLAGVAPDSSEHVIDKEEEAGHDRCHTQTDCIVADSWVRVVKEAALLSVSTIPHLAQVGFNECYDQQRQNLQPK